MVRIILYFTGANATFRANKINQLAAYAPFPFQLSIFSGVIATGVMNAEEGRLIMTKTYENVTIPGSPTYTYGHLLYGGDAIAFSTGTKDVSGAYPITNSITFSGAGITFGGPSCVSTFNGSSLVVNSPATITDRINLWSASNPVLDIQNSLRITTSNGAFQIAKIDGGNILWNAPLRIQPNTATVLVSATVARHLAQGGFTAPTSGTDWWLSFDITNKGFTSKPNWGMGQAIEDSMYSVAYRDDASTTTTAYFMVRKRSGAAWAGELVWVKTILELIA